MDFRHLIVTCLFSMLRLSFETQKIKENYAILTFKRADSFFFLGIHVLNMPHYLLATSVSFYYRGTMKKHFTSKHKAKSFLLRSIEPFNLQRKEFL